MKIKYILDASDLIEIPIYVKWSDNGIYILNEEDVSKLSDPLPNDVRKEVTKWKQEDWATRTFIDSMSTKQMDNGTMQTDFNKHTDLFVQCLLKDWTLSEVDDNLRLMFIDRGDVTVIDPKVMGRIRKLPANIMTSIVTKAMLKIRGGPDLKN